MRQRERYVAQRRSLPGWAWRVAVNDALASALGQRQATRTGGVGPLSVVPALTADHWSEGVAASTTQVRLGVTTSTQVPWE